MIREKFFVLNQFIRMRRVSSRKNEQIKFLENVSGRMELAGLVRILNRMEGMKLPVNTLTTDRHTQIVSYMKKERPDIRHIFDFYHLFKGVGRITRDVNFTASLCYRGFIGCEKEKIRRFE